MAADSSTSGIVASAACVVVVGHGHAYEGAAGCPAGAAGVPAVAVGPVIVAAMRFSSSRRSLSSFAPRNFSSCRSAALCSPTRA
eukprot:3796175-Pyramimonas_sp.AAC.1